MRRIYLQLKLSVSFDDAKSTTIYKKCTPACMGHGDLLNGAGVCAQGIMYEQRIQSQLGGPITNY